MTVIVVVTVTVVNLWIHLINSRHRLILVLTVLRIVDEGAAIVMLQGSALSCILEQSRLDVLSRDVNSRRGY